MEGRRALDRLYRLTRPRTDSSANPSRTGPVSRKRIRSTSPQPVSCSWTGSDRVPLAANRTLPQYQGAGGLPRKPTHCKSTAKPRMTIISDISARRPRSP
jgi:hypothetical protein